ncbi:hypothetical protein HY500_01155 [Candidatus Woesearchaeota archaeon]|nr:hypothetical protein [Candidatus Woesearchaeota archaeon]
MPRCLLTGEKGVREENPFPEDLEGRMANVLSAVNTEFKTATLLHLDGNFSDSDEIEARIRQTIGKGQLPKSHTFGSYGRTLYNMAFVAEETIFSNTGEKGYIGYSLTEAGRIYGLPVANFVLKWAVDNSTSMFTILGSITFSGKKRAPYNRIRILEVLSIGKANEADIAEFLNLSPTSVCNNLSALSKQGFVDFDSVGAMQRGYSKYVWTGELNPEDIEPVKVHPTLKRRIAELMTKGDEMNSRDIAARLKCSQTVASTILSELEREGALQRTTLWTPKKYQSEAELLDSGRRFLEEVVQPMRDHLSNNSVLTIDFGHDFSYYVKQGVELYRKISPMINKKTPKERMEELKLILLTTPNTTTREIGRVTGQSMRSVAHYIQMLGKKVRKDEVGNEVRYSLN